MKKLATLTAAFMLFAGASFAHDGKDCKGKECTKEEMANCKKDKKACCKKEAKTTTVKTTKAVKTTAATKKA